MGNICLDFREGEIDGILTPTRYHAHYVLPSTRTYSPLSHVRVHIVFTHYVIRGAL